MLDESFHPLDDRSSVLGSDKKRTAIKDLQSPLIPVRFVHDVTESAWPLVCVTCPWWRPGLLWRTECLMIPSVRSRSQRPSQVSDTMLQRTSGLHTFGHFHVRSILFCHFLMFFVKMFRKELWDYFWQPWSGMLWLVSARSHKLSGDCRNFDKAGSQQSR